MDDTFIDSIGIRALCFKSAVPSVKPAVPSMTVGCYAAIE